MFLKPFFIFENDFNLGFTFTANACVSVRYGEPLFLEWNDAVTVPVVVMLFRDAQPIEHSCKVVL